MSNAVATRPLRGLAWKMGAAVLLLVVVGAVALERGALGWARLGADDEAPINVLLISLDTTRKDRLSCYGYQRLTTPRIDKLAEESLVFTRCVAVSNWTLPSHASMLCGLYPTSHGARWHFTDMSQVKSLRDPPGTMSLECESLAEILQANGYRTAAVLANSFWLNEFTQLNQGFDLFDASTGDELMAPFRQAEEITDTAVDWLEEGREQPFFLCLNYLDPHAPYNPPPPYDALFVTKASKADSQELRYWQYWLDEWTDARKRVIGEGEELSPAELAVFEERYDGEIAYMDAHIGRLLDWLRDTGQYDRTLVFVTADHGEVFGEHGLFGHAFRLYEPEIAVPMLVKLPFSGRKGEVDHGVQHVDIMPTALEILGLPIPEAVQGQSMLAPSDRALVAEEYVFPKLAGPWPQFNHVQHAIYYGTLKYIENSDGKQELFDLEQDPGEQTDLAELREDDTQALAAMLDNWRELVQPIEQQRTVPREWDPEHEQRLKDLGYVGGN